MTTTLQELETTERSVDALIADAVSSSEEPNAHRIAQRVARELESDQLQSLAAEALSRAVRRYISSLSAPAADGSSLGVPRSTRWGQVRQSAASGDLDLARMEVDTGQHSKPLLDCMYADLADASENHLRFALANEVFAEQYRKLADRLLEDDDARTVRDLPEQEVRRILSA